MTSGEANIMLELSHDIRKASTLLERNAEALRTATEALLATKREVHDGNAEHDKTLRLVHHELKQMNTLLGVISKDVDDVERVTREATGAHALAAIDPKVKLLQEFGRLDRFTKVLIAIAVVSGGAIGVLVYWIATHWGK